MESKFILYVLDTETTGLDDSVNEIIELSILRMNDGAQKTWCIKPSNYESIQPDALRINGHKLEDLKHLTKHGRDTYLEPAQVVAEIENWMMEDFAASGDRVLVGQNINFDLNFIKKMWDKCGNKDTFPFGNRPALLDTMQLALFLDIVKNERSDFYNLNSLIKKYGIKNMKAHTAAADTRATQALFECQVNDVRSMCKIKE